MSTLIRGGVALLVFVTVFIFSFLYVSIEITGDEPFWLPRSIALVLASVSAFWVWWSMQAGKGGILGTVFRWAATAGAVGFCLRFFGPMILAPQSNQGPLLGILVTGPFGFMAGGAR